MLTVFGDDDAVQRSHAAGFGAGRLEDPADAATLVAQAQALDCRVVVVDSYLIHDEYLSALRSAGLFVVAVDDLNEYPFPCQMVVSMGPHAPDAGYRSSTGDTGFLLGPQWAILRPEYWETPLPQMRDSVANIVVTSGGADPGGCLPSWLRLIDRIDQPFSVTAVVGPFFTNGDDVHATAADCLHTVRVIQSPSLMRPLLARADIVLTAGGQTIYEAAALGIPAVAVEIALNQGPQLEAFERLGAMRVAGRAGDAQTDEDIVRHVTELVRDGAVRRRLSEAALGVVNRAGALRVAEEIVRASALGGSGQA